MGVINQHSYGKSQFLMGKSTINGPFSIATLNYQRVVVGVNYRHLQSQLTMAALGG